MIIYVDNLSTRTTESDLENVFEDFGRVQAAKVIRNRINGESEGFGFVDMPTKAEAKKAIGVLNGTDLMGKALIVK